MSDRPHSERVPERDGERGAALLTVLAIVAVMSVLAVGVSEAVSLAARRGANVAARNQALWYLYGVEDLAAAALTRSHALDAELTTLDQPWARGPLRFEVEGGVIEGELVDAGNCFNLNSLAKPLDDEGFMVDDGAMESLIVLLRAIDIDAGTAQRLAAGAADWIDADDSARSGGAEDYDYAFAEPPYRAPNGPFADVDELRGVAGVSEGLFREVRPYLCAGDADAPQTLNINTLRADQAALLTTVFGGRLAMGDALGVLSDRPAGGWTDEDAFWTLEPIAALEPSEEQMARVALRSTMFELHARVVHYDAFVEARTWLRQEDNGDVHVVRRRIGDQS